MSKVFKRTKILATIGPVSGNGSKSSQSTSPDDYFPLGSRAPCEYLPPSEQTKKRYNHPGKLIAKIETKKAVESDENLQEIVNEVDGPRFHFIIIIFQFTQPNLWPLQILNNRHTSSFFLGVGEPILLFDGKVTTRVKDIPSETAIELEVLNDGFCSYILF